MGADADDEQGVGVLVAFVAVGEQQGLEAIDLLDVANVDQAILAPVVEVHQLLILPVPVFHPGGDGRHVLLAPGTVHALEAVGGAQADIEPVKQGAAAGHISEVFKGAALGELFGDEGVNDQGQEEDGEHEQADTPERGFKGSLGDHAAGAGPGGAAEQGKAGDGADRNADSGGEATAADSGHDGFLAVVLRVS